MSTDYQQPSNQDSTAFNQGSTNNNSSSNHSNDREIESFNSLDELMNAYSTEEEDDDDIVDDWLNGGSDTDEEPEEYSTPTEQADDDYEEEEEEEYNDFEGYEEEDDEEEEEIFFESSEKESSSNAHTNPNINVGELFSRVGDAKNIERTGQYAFDQFDKFKARLCAKLDGERYASEFLASEEMKTILINNFKAVCKELKIEVPTSGLIFMGSLAMYSAPVLMLLLEKYGKKYLLPLFTKATPKQTPQNKAKPIIKEQDQHPYAHTREYQEKRKYFQRHSSTGAYKYTLTGQAIKVAIADEMPHPDIAEILDDLEEQQGKKGINKEMRILLNVQ